MHKVRVYVDTSVIGGTQDEEFSGPSERFFERVRNGQYVLLVSPTMTGELEEAPPAVRAVMDTLPPDCIEYVPVGTEVDILANAYIEAGALGRAHQADASHVAAATVAGADLILSWNFKHIVRYDRVQKFNGVNAINGYRTLDIRSPMEIDYDPEDEDI
jgi:hypothetical protein